VRVSLTPLGQGVARPQLEWLAAVNEKAAVYAERFTHAATLAAMLRLLPDDRLTVQSASNHCKIHHACAPPTSLAAAVMDL
jgi:hypothetical protein